MADESKKAKIEIRSKTGDDMSKEDESNNSSLQENALDKKFKKSVVDQSQKDCNKNPEGA